MSVSFSKSGIVTTSGIDVGENLIITNSMAPLSGTSGWSSAGNGWVNSNVIAPDTTNCHAIRCTFTGSTGVSGGIHHPTGNTKGDLTDGATYTLSARIRASKACRATFHNELQTIGNTIDLTTDWKIYSFSSPIDNSHTYHSNTIYVTAVNVTDGMWIECEWFKLELGDKATPWIPHVSNYGAAPIQHGFAEQDNLMKVYEDYITTNDFIEY